VDFIRIRGEMDKRASLELEQRGIRIALVFVLPDSILPGLVGVRILQLDCGDRYSVQGKDNVNVLLSFG
jgi:hypothetical protein